MSGEHGLVKVADPDYQGLIMAVAPAEARRRLEELQAFIQQVMQGPELHPDGSVKRHGIDFDVIPGTEKPTLLQPGAQKLCELYGLAAEFIIDEKTEDWDRPFFYYRMRVVLTDRRSGAFVGMGIGSCNSMEKKYRGRWVAEVDAPSWLDVKKLKSREAIEWLWASKLRERGITSFDGLQTKEREGKNGRFTVYAVKTAQVFVPNEDIPDLVNTFQKMAAKRAHVHAVLQVTRSAGIFSQDLDDVPAEALGYVDQRRPWEREEIIDAEVVPTPERADLAAQREKMAAAAQKVTASRAQAAGPAPSSSAPPAEEAGPDPAAAPVPALVALLDATPDGNAFNKVWKTIKARADFATISGELRESWDRNFARLWPEEAEKRKAAAAKAAPAQAAPATPPRDPRIDTWLSNISRAGGDEGEQVWNAMNDAFEGNVPPEVMAAFEARWPTKE